MRPKHLSSLQKTYDECYLMCSTAVYFEGQNNEDEALKSWRSALEAIYCHNAYRAPSKYTPKNETERALQESLRQLELQCRERVDLIEALRESRKDSSSAPTRRSPAATPSGWIGDGTIPAVGYSDLSKPPPLPTRPTPMISGPSVRPSAPRTQSHSSSSINRNSSPERRSLLPSTLRSLGGKKNKKKTSPRRTPRPAAASQAAGLAWGSISAAPPRPDRTATEAAVASSRQAAADRSRQSDALRPRPVVVRRETSEDPRAGRKLDSPASRSSAQAASPAKSAPPTPRRDATPRTVSSTEPRETARVRDSPRPSIRSKPAALRSSVPPEAAPPSPSSAPPPVSNSPRTDATPRPRPTAAAGLASGVDKMSIDRDSPAPKTRSTRAMTPPSSDPESSGPRSTDLDDEEGDEEAEEDPMTHLLPKLPKGVDETAARQILNDIVVRGDEVHWDDIAGLEGAKTALKEAVVYPFLRPDLFSGLREPARGMLLFGPPGTGKTMLARAVATESQSTFFSVSASTLTSKWHGESEKLVRALFGLAKALAPSIIFVDEIDSLLSARSSGSENEASRRSKTEFLIQWSDLQRAAAGREQKKATSAGDPSRVLVLAATNMPWDIDEAARRRFVRRQYIPLPEDTVREQQLRTLLGHQVHELGDGEIQTLVGLTDGFSGSDITALAKDAAMGPLRNLGEALLHTPMDQIRPIRFEDFQASLASIRPSVSQDGLREYEEWAAQFGERGG
ncbi:AAA-domain-containing protein [Aspergillus campestris IBT 28561]|uniref:AAA-domain-containing protein n=1 Tax=Aspergillus campestris (strain IBT 28561) TaxID=1392248 RepID=A0A2I1DBV7_ASPC2|nr:AAA-domain-containing protein [Aspergillus campestris IBT 28561]PKY07350.1 AAA-domain-containing protein [Aspergillus campestris IBT 28561]